MEILGVYDYMRLTILALLLLAGSIYSQDSTKIFEPVFEYRFKIPNIHNELDAGLIEEELFNLFKVEPVYYKEISEYAFISLFEISRPELEAILRRRELSVMYYRKTLVPLKNGNE